MDDIFLILAFISLFVLAVGLIKPSVYAKSIKNPSRKKIAGIIGTATLALFIAFGLTTDETSSQPKTETQSEALEIQDKKVVYVLEAEAKSVNNAIDIKGTTNLPEGSILEVSANRMFVFSGESDTRHGLQGRGYQNVKATKGEFKTTIKLDDKKFLDFIKASGETITLNPNLNVEVVFNPRQNQTPDTLAIVGENGEQLETSSSKKVIGEATIQPYNTLEFRTEVPLAFPYLDQL
jgi:hypothetical protein